jgi:hypothetical protein
MKKRNIKNKPKANTQHERSYITKYPRKNEIPHVVRAGYVYVARTTQGHYKIGYATKLDNLKGDSWKQYGVEITLLFVLRTHSCMQLKWYLQKKFGHKFTNQYKINGISSQDFFSLNEEDLNFIRSLTTFDGKPLKIVDHKNANKSK